MAREGSVLRRLLGDRRGASAVQLALATPMLGFALMGSYDLARGFSARIDLAQAAARSAELATSYGQVRTDYSVLRQEAVDSALRAGLPNPVATVDFWLECNGVRAAPTANICPSGQTYARYVAVRIDATYVPVFGLFGNAFPLTGRATVRIQ
jgi:hypothetical protein